MVVIHMGGHLRYRRMKNSDVVETSIQQVKNMKKQHDPYAISPQLSKEQLQQMMQVVEDIRLNRNKKYL